MARLLHLADLHAAAPGALVSGVLDTCASLRAGIDLLAARMDALGPLDAVLVTGDVSDDGSAESYAFARAQLDRLGLPLLVAPGNHDRRGALRAAFADVAHMPREGLIDWEAEVAGSLVVGLDTLVEGQGAGRLRAQSLTHLASALDRADGRDMVIAMHHPPIRTGIRFMDAIGLENPGDLARCLSGARGRIRILAGHVHGVYHGRIAGHAVLTAPALCSGFALDLRPGAPAGFMAGPRGCAVIDTGPDGVWTTIPLDAFDGPHAF